MKDKMKEKPSFKHAHIRDNQRGALLVGLIITMVILSVLGGSMVYIFSSSTLNPISGTYAQQAYYNAEAGFRYVTGLYRNTGLKAKLDPYKTQQTIALPNGGTAKVTLTEPTSIVPATFTAGTGGGGTLAFSTPYPTLADLKAPGFFSPDDATTVTYRYGGLTPTYTGTTITGATLTGITPSVPASGTAIKIKRTTYITSIGTFGSGLWNVSRTVNYAWALSGSSGGFKDTFTDLSNWNTVKMEQLGSFSTPTGTYMQVDEITKAGGAVMGIASSGSGSGILPDNVNYDAQVKVRAWVPSTSSHLSDFLAGLSFRADQPSTTAANFYTFHTSFFQMNTSPTEFELPEAVYTNRSTLNIKQPYILFWIDAGNDASKDSELLGYKSLLDSNGMSLIGPVLKDDMETNNWTSSGTTNASWTYENSSTATDYVSSSHYYMVNLSSEVNGKFSYLTSNTTKDCAGAPSAYLSFWYRLENVSDATASVWISSNNGTSWNQLTGISLSPTPIAEYKNIGYKITDPGYLTSSTKIRFQIETTKGGAYAKMYIDDVSITPAYLADWSTIMVRIREIVVTDTFFGTGTTSVNDIEIFYGSTATHGTGKNTITTDDNRDGNPLGEANWMPDPITTPLTNTYDKFTLVSGWTLTSYATPTKGCKYKLVSGSSSNESNAIIRTNCRVPSDGKLQSTRSEVGVHAFGSATNVQGHIFFADFATNTGGSGSGGGYVPPIQY